MNERNIGQRVASTTARVLGVEEEEATQDATLADLGAGHNDPGKLARTLEEEFGVAPRIGVSTSVSEIARQVKDGLEIARLEAEAAVPQLD